MQGSQLYQSSKDQLLKSQLNLVLRATGWMERLTLLAFIKFRKSNVSGSQECLLFKLPDFSLFGQAALKIPRKLRTSMGKGRSQAVPVCSCTDFRTALMDTLGSSPSLIWFRTAKSKSRLTSSLFPTLKRPAKLKRGNR